MMESCYVVYDLLHNTKKRCGSYAEYLDYFRTRIKPQGYGTRFMFSEIVRKQYVYHLRLVREAAE